MGLIDSIVEKWSNVAFILDEDISNDRFVKSAKDKLSSAVSDKLKNDNDLMAAADEIGINPSYNQKDLYSEREKALNGLDLSTDITEKTKKTIDILSKITGKTGGQNWNKLRNMVSNGETYGLSYNEVLRMKDFIDSLDLRYMYDKSISPSSKRVLKYGNKLDSDGNLDDSQFDLNNIGHNDVLAWKKPSSRKYTYTDDEAVFQMKRNIVDRYLASTYGVEMDIPNFSLGNMKVKDALLINFTSAYRCPAWNECLVKNACYARSGEGRHYENEKLSNDKKHLMWEAGHNDPEFMRLIKNMLKAYVVDYESVIGEVRDMTSDSSIKQELSDMLSKVGNRINGDRFMSLDFTDMPSCVIDIIKDNTRVKDIRLNENGDFIGQWLLDEFDKIAGEFRVIGVKTAAYSCRNLNFDGIKNIIINASRINMKGSSIARYFYAVPQEMYDAMEDTYVGKNIGKDIDSIERRPLPLYSVGSDGSKVPNGNYYYKCPCGRTDFVSGGKTVKKVNCYQCHLCYEEPDGATRELMAKNGGKYIVFVKAHGTYAGKIDRNSEIRIANTVGVPEDYVIGNGAVGDMPIHEAEEQDTMPSQDEAINTITDNAVMSMNERLGGIGENAISEQREMFWRKLNGIEKKVLK